MEKLLKNLEKMDPEERKRLQQMIKEQDESSREGQVNMEWMYKGDKPDSEEYLLGRRIDRHIDENKEDDENKDAPGALFSEEFLAKRAELDMQAKMREDPLFQIRQQEEDARKKLVQNPIKIKQLQKMVDEQRAKKKSKKDKKHKKKKKHKKHKSDSPDDSSDSDSDLINRYLAIVTQKHKGKKEAGGESGAHLHRKRQDSSDSSQEDERKQYGLVGGKKSTHVRDQKHSHRKRSRSRSPQIHRSRSPKRQSSHRARSRSPQKHRTRSPQRQKPRSPQRQRSRSPLHRGRSRSPTRRQRSRSPDRPQHSKGARDRSPPRKHKLSSEEKERKLKEMMENAKWRDEQREKNVERYKEQDDKESKLLDRNKHSQAEFLNPMMMEHASQSSVEDRIKRNKYNIQRTKVDLDKHFHKR